MGMRGLLLSVTTGVDRRTLRPGKVSPLRAIFDTGAIPLIAQPV